MKYALSRRLTIVCLLAATVGAANLSCITSAGDTFHYLTQERAGNVSVQFINNTPFRAIFSFGTYDSLDRNPPGPVSLNQQRLEANSVSTPVAAPCRRDAALGTAEYIQRVVDTKGDTGNNFDADAFNPVINFSSAPQGSTSEALPTEGTADGLTLRLGVDFKCGDTIIFTFEVDPNSPGGFRVDHSILSVKPADE